VARQMFELHSLWDTGAQGGKCAVGCDQRATEALDTVDDEVCEFWVYVSSNLAPCRIESIDQHDDF